MTLYEYVEIDEELKRIINQCDTQLAYMSAPSITINCTAMRIIAAELLRLRAIQRGDA